MYEHYSLAEAQNTVNAAVSNVQQGEMSLEQAVAAAVESTIRAFATIMCYSYDCCGCHYMESSAELFDTAQHLTEQYQQITV